MKLSKIISRFSILFGVLLASLEYTYALPPVDFVMQIVANTGIYVSMGIAIIATFIGSTYRLFQGFYSKYKIGIIVSIILIIALGITISLKFVAQSEIEILFEEKETQLIQWLYSGNKIESNIKTDTDFIEDINLDSLIKSEHFITNNEFKDLLLGNRNDIFILDGREDIEYELGHISGAIQMRAADLKHDNVWENIPTDKIVIVTCWTGMRGKVIRDYVTSKGFEARFLENGIESWLENNGEFEGTTELTEIYTDEKYTYNLHPLNVDKYISEGALVIDSREDYKTSRDPIENALIISEMNTSTKDINIILKSISKDQKVIVMCDDPVNCYDANMIGVKLEKLGIEFLGRFSRNAISITYTDIG